MSASNADTATVLSLRQLRLRPGMFLQVHRPNDQRHQVEAKFCAAIEGKGLMLVPLAQDANGPDWSDGSAATIRGFTGQFDFTFESKVLGSFSVPFAYVLMAYPEQVSARHVRSALRIRTSIASMAWGSNDQATVPARLVDLSVAGAMIELASPLGSVGDPLNLAVDLPFEHGKERLELGGTICHSGEGAAGARTRVGMAFANLSKHERLLLQNFTLAAMQSPAVID